MATPCLRRCVENINQLLSQKIPVYTPDGYEIEEASPLILSAKNHKITVSLKLRNGKRRSKKFGFRATERGKEFSSWIVPNEEVIAWYEDTEDEDHIEGDPPSKRWIVAKPKIYLEDNYVPLPKSKKDLEVDCPISGDFNGGTELDGYHVKGYSCKNHAPEGYILHSSWGSLEGSIPLLMTYRLVQKEKAI